ncbi:DUF6414 family protein [Janibacter terrae]|uniref:DUF6414 family protein n=1 Tax=Janibacter terrae TaxID=103817 RepID=UPI0031F74BE3
MPAHPEAYDRKGLPERPTMAVYQNGDAVEGILQQVYKRPLIIDESTASSRQDDHRTESEGAATGQGSGTGKVPGMASIEAGIGADFRRRNESGATTTGSSTSTWQYTQAYYLYAVKDALRTQGLVSPLNGRTDAKHLRPGDFVEFTCRFDPSQVAALLDIVTPDLVRAIAVHIKHTKMMKSFGGATRDDVLAYIDRMNLEKAAIGDFAHAVASATGVDFRSAKTREFYGQVGEEGDGVTAITMCDLAHFVVEDEDRLLDGEFSVLAKVTEGLIEDVPILDRNKVLSRLDAASVDELLDSLNTDVLTDMQRDASSKARKGMARGRGQEVTEGDGKNGDLGFDLSIDSRVAGPCLKVMPVAIYI